MNQSKRDEKMTKNDKLDVLNKQADVLARLSGKAVRPYRADGYVNLITKYGTSKDASESYSFVPEPIVPDNALTMYYQYNGLFSRIIDIPAEEAVKHGFSLQDLKDQKTIDFYSQALDELDWTTVAMTSIKWTRLFGGAIAVMLINDGRGIEEPVDWDNIKSIDDIRVFDRSVVTPDVSSIYSHFASDPFGTRGSRLGMPEYYRVSSRYGSFTVHESRCLVFQNGTLPENCDNANYQLWGMPEYIRIRRALLDAELALRSGPKMLDKSVQPIYKMSNLAAELATEEGENRVLRRMQIIDTARGMLNSLVIDKDGEEYDFRQFQFAGAAEIINASCDFLSALTSIPQTKLFGRSPAGMNATGQSDLENYYSYCEGIQNSMLKSNLRYLLSVIFQAGLYTKEIDEMPKIKVEFNTMWSLSEAEKASLDQQKESTKQIKASTAQVYVSMGALDPNEIRKKLAEEEEFDVENVLDGVDEDDLFANVQQQGEEAAMQQPQVEAAIPQQGAVQQTAEGQIDTGNAPEAAPEATKLPQDMDKEKIDKNDSENDDKLVQSRADALSNDNLHVSSVGVLVVKDGKILCGERLNDETSGQICGPGGHVENNETAGYSAARETSEEFGIIPNELIHIGYGPAEKNGLQPYIFLCTSYEGEPICDEEEMTGASFKTLEELNAVKDKLFKPFADSLDILAEVLNGKPDNIDGGPGSGNFGHKGVEGQVGGSAPSEEKGQEKPISSRTKPAVKTAKEFDDYVSKNGLKTIYRGYSASSESELAERESQLHQGTAPSSGDATSALGNGIYFSNKKSEAESYMNRRMSENGEKHGKVTTASLDVGSKVVDFNDCSQQKLNESHEIMRKAFKETDPEKRDKLGSQADSLWSMSVSDYAKSKGYDAIFDSGTGYTVVVNPNAVVYRKDSNDDGGPGSGNFGHKGVVGQVGGSAPSGKSSAEWKSKLDSQKEDLLSQGSNEQARQMYDLGVLDLNTALAQMKDGSISKTVDSYFDIMQANGDPTPTKKTVSSQRSLYDVVDSEYGGDWSKARVGEIIKDTGVSESEAEDMKREISDVWTTGSWSNAKSEVLDKYVEKAPTYEGTIYRGMHFTSPEDYDNFMSQIQSGSVKMKGNSSWTSDKSVARRFSHMSQDDIDSVEIKCISNRTAAPIDHLVHSNGGEDEVLAHSKTAWSVLSVSEFETKNGGRKAVITVVEKGEFEDE